MHALLCRQQLQPAADRRCGGGSSRQVAAVGGRQPAASSVQRRRSWRAAAAGAGPRSSRRQLPGRSWHHTGRCERGDSNHLVRTSNLRRLCAALHAQLQDQQQARRGVDTRAAPASAAACMQQVAVYCTLLALREAGTSLPPAVAAWFDKVAAAPQVKAGTEQVSSSAGRCGSSSIRSAKAAGAPAALCFSCRDALHAPRCLLRHASCWRALRLAP